METGAIADDLTWTHHTNNSTTTAARRLLLLLKMQQKHVGETEEPQQLQMLRACEVRSLVLGDKWLCEDTVVRVAAI